jgi:hypothetical protein
LIKNQIQSKDTPMTNTPLFKPTPDGYDIQPAGVLIMLASHIYDPESDLSPDGKDRLKGHIDAVMAAARAGGFTQCDILATLLSRNEVSHRVKAMAVQACEAAGNEAIGRIFDAMRGESKDVAGGGGNPEGAKAARPYD